MHRTVGDSIFDGLVPTGVVGVAAASCRAVISDVRKGIGAVGRIIREHRIGPESALTPKGQRAVIRGRYAAKEFIVEGLARARTVARYRIARLGRPLFVVLVAAMLASWPDCGLMPVEALNTAYQSSMNSTLPLMPRPVCCRLFGAMRNWE